MAGSYDLVLDQGATWQIVCVWKIAGTPVNLTGFTARMQVRSGFESTDPILDLTSAGGDIVLGGSAGTIAVTVSAAVSAEIAANKYRYDLELESAAGVVTRLLNGYLTSRREVTR
jgi:hypothetical protein